MSEYKVVENPDYQEPEATYRCYNCGNVDGFYEYSYPAGDHDICCSKCDSPNTFWDGEGEPECPNCYGHFGWECAKCDIMMCEECWTWGELGDSCIHCGADR